TRSYFRSGGTVTLALGTTDDSNTLGIIFGSARYIGWSDTSADGSANLRIYRDNSDILAQRRGNNGQILRVGYNFTDASNYSWGMIDAGQTNANELGIGSRSFGSPGQKLTKLAVYADGTQVQDYAKTTASTMTSTVPWTLTNATIKLTGVTTGTNAD